MKIKDIMTSDVETVAPGASLQEAATKMRGSDCGSVPVADGGKVVGIITDRDIVVRAVAQGGSDFFAKKVSDVMSTDVACVREEDDVSAAEELMERRQIRRVCVVDAGGALRGIVSLGDLATEEPAAKTGEVLEKVSEPSHTGYSGRSPSSPSGTSYHSDQGYGSSGQGRGTA